MRCFEDPNVIHVAGRVDPIADIEVIQTELCLADLGTVEKSLQRYTKAAKSGNDKEAAKLVQVLTKVQGALDEGRPVRTLELSDEERALIKPLCLITAKPAMFVGNVSEDGFENNPLLDRLKDYAATQNAPVVAICAKMEADMADMSDEDRALFLAEMGQDEPGLNRLIRAAFKLLGLQTYFTVGVKEVRAWTIHIGDTPRRRRASSTATSSAASSAPKPSLTKTSSPTAASRAPRTPARCAPKARTMSSKTAT